MKQKSIGLCAATFLSLGLVSAGSAEAITFNLHWTGQTLGYQVKGSFSYDENAVGENGIVREGDLTSLDLTFIDPNGNVFEEFFNNHLSPFVNFNFDTNTKEILQTGAYDADDGISIGGERGEEVNFFSAPDAMVDLFPHDNDPSPHVHLTDWDGDFLGLPIGFRRGAVEHLDIAFFTRSRAEVLDVPNAGEELGQFFIATQVPEPTGILGLGVLGLSALLVKKKSS